MPKRQADPLDEMIALELQQKKKKKSKKESKKESKNGDHDDAVVALVGGKLAWHQLIYRMLSSAKAKNLRRTEDHVLVPHPTVKGVFLEFQEAENYINAVCKGMPELCQQSNTMQRLINFFEHIDHEYFPIVSDANLRQDVIAFRNGYYKYHEQKFVKEIEGSTMHFFDCDYHEKLLDEDTPHWDNLLMTQVKTADVKDFVEILIGRMLFPIGWDNWQLCLFLKGLANTGKSTLIGLILAMMPKNSHAILASNQEAVFGLENVYKKRVFACPDMPVNMARVLDSALLQAMISGESISVPRKGRKALTIESWGAHLIFASNFLPNYDDATGAISRRMVIIPYETTVAKRDPLLKEKIVKQELSKVLLRCISKYRTFLDVHREEDILDLLPEACKLESSKAVLSLDPIREFLENGNETNIVRKKKDSQVPWSTFVSNYKLFYQEKFGGRKVMVKDSDKITINSVGYHVEEVTVCKECNKDATKENCGEHYDRNNRRRKVVIKGMQIVSKHSQTFARGPSLGKGIPNEFYQHLARKHNPDLPDFSRPIWPDDAPEM
jgi:hypothetical protein